MLQAPVESPSKLCLLFAMSKRSDSKNINILLYLSVCTHAVIGQFIGLYYTVQPVTI